LLKKRKSRPRIKQRLADAAAYGWRDYAQFRHELRELFYEKRLRAIGERVLGIVMDFD
jgi:hypothetical protein